MGRKKLTWDDVRQIRAEYKVVKNKAINVIELAQRYGIPQERVRKIAKGHKNVA